MKQRVSLREANQHLSRYVAAVERGGEVVITRRGRPVARIVRVAARRELTPSQVRAWKRIKAGAARLAIGPLRRDDLHER
jgi:prevent-host-death family protein